MRGLASLRDHSQTEIMTKQNKLSGPTVKAIPEGDTLPRLVCPDCGFINYVNPKIVVGAICEWEDKVLLCKRAIEPRLGYWTPPGGFMELDETTAEGAQREVWEEACARVEIGQLIGIFEIPHISQVHMFYHARLITPEYAAGPESQDVALFTEEEIPWDDLAFSSGTWAMRRFYDGDESVGHTLGHLNPKF